MAGKRKVPRLRYDGRYYVANFYKPDGTRAMVSFGPLGERTEGKIFSIFGQWLDLYDQFPQKVLSFKSPYEALEQLTNPTKIVHIGELLDQYLAWVQRNLSMEGVEKSNNTDIVIRTKRLKKFLENYLDWPIGDFGPDELKTVQQAMRKHKYLRGKKKVAYTRRGINDNIKHIRRIWEWGIGREFVTVAQAKRLEEVKSLRVGQAPDNQNREKVSFQDFVKVIKSVNSVVADMLWLIWYTAMRPGEVCRMRPFDILRDDPECWLYIPGRDKSPIGEHKTSRFGKLKAITLTRKSQEILLRRILDFNSKEYIFSPGDAIREMYAARAKNRKTPLSYGNHPGTNCKEHPMITPGQCYAANALRIACKRGCHNIILCNVREN